MLHQKSGFSVVEIIVVLAIIGLLTSSILAYTMTSREKAVLASQQQAAASIDHTIGDQYVGAWNFNDCSSEKTIDNSGNKHDGTLQGAIWSSDSPYSKGCSLLFLGSQSVNIVAPNLPAGKAARTVTLWIKPFQENATMPIFSFGQGDCTSRMFSLKLNNGKIQFYGGCNNYTSNLAIAPNQWTFISFTYNGKDTVKLSANGKSETFAAGELDTVLSEFNIGAETLNNGESFKSYYIGFIDNIHFFSAGI